LLAPSQKLGPPVGCGGVRGQRSIHTLPDLMVIRPTAEGVRADGESVRTLIGALRRVPREALAEFIEEKASVLS